MIINLTWNLMRFGTDRDAAIRCFLLCFWTGPLLVVSIITYALVGNSLSRIATVQHEEMEKQRMMDSVQKIVVTAHTHVVGDAAADPEPIRDPAAEPISRSGSDAIPGSSKADLGAALDTTMVLVPSLQDGSR